MFDDEETLVDKIDALAFSLIGGHFTNKRDQYATLDQKLNQARMDVDYDMYVSRVYFLAIVMAIAGFLFGLLIVLFLISTGLILMSLPITFPGEVASFIEQYRIGLVTIAVSILMSVLFFLSTLGWGWYHPRYKAGARARKINVILPSAITYMYALSRGGMNVVEVFESMAESDDVYGEVAREFEVIVNDMELFGRDLNEAMANASQSTPSTDLGRFLNDMMSLIDSGGEVEQFLVNKSDQYLKIRQQNEQGFLDTLAFLSETYVTAFVAAPLFIIVILSVMTVLGNGDSTQLFAIIYVVLPMSSVGFIIVLDVISPGIDREIPKIHTEDAAVIDEEIKEEYPELEKAEKRYAFREFLKNPTEKIQEEPAYALIVSVPVALIYIALIFGMGWVPFEFEAYKGNAWYNSVLSLMIPLSIITLPVAFFYEKQSRKRKSINKDLPVVLRKLSNSNEAGMSLAESCRLVSKTSSGVLPSELGRVYNLATWNMNVSRALKESANRLRIPRYSRTIKLITEAKDASGDIKDVLNIASRDAEAERNFDRERTRNMQIYVLIIIVSYAVFLFVLILLESFFLQRMANVGGGETQGGSQQMSAVGFDPSQVPIETYRMLFFHAGILQGLTSGLMAGKMADDNVMGGLKYGFGMMVLATLAFFFM